MLALAQGHRLIMVSRREDIPRGLALGPTYLFSVPLVYDRIREEVQARVPSRPAPVRALSFGPPWPLPSACRWAPGAASRIAAWRCLPVEPWADHCVRGLADPGGLADYPALLTPTLKLKRDVFQRWKQAEVEQLYRDAAATRR
jgi:hypothetical protein